MPSYCRTLQLKVKTTFTKIDRGNLNNPGFSPFKDGDLKEENLMSCLECLAQLHGTGIAYKLFLGGKKELLEEFPDMQEQAQIKVSFKLCYFFT